MGKTIRVLIVDDSALVRQVFSDSLSKDPQIEVVGTASNAFRARDLILKTKPDVMTLDVSMPQMDGVSFLRMLMPQYPIPVIMVSSFTQAGTETTLNALAAGAVDFLAKPTADLSNKLNQMVHELAAKIKIAARANLRQVNKQRQPLLKAPLLATNPKDISERIIAIGASTGGVTAIEEVLCGLPANGPGILIVQHMPDDFITPFAQRLDMECPQHVKRAEDGDRLVPGLVLIAPGNAHLRLIRHGGFYKVTCVPGERICGHCPSVEVLFDSVARCAGPEAIGVMLTGMGRDGAQGLLRMKMAGARTIGQDEASSVVYGMPQEAFSLGAVEIQVSLDRIAATILAVLMQKTKAKA